MTPQEFINKIAPSFQKWGKQYGYKIVSAAIAQACLESAYGTSYKATHGNNILGLKYRPNRITCNNGYFEMEDLNKIQMEHILNYHQIQLGMLLTILMLALKDIMNF